MLLRRLPPVLSLTLVLCSASSAAPIPQLKDRNTNGHFGIEQQLPAYNSPVKTDAHGIDHAGGVHINHNEDFESPTNRLGAGGVLPHSGQAVLEQTDLVFNGRDNATRLEIKRRHVSRTNQRSSIFGPAWAFNYRHYFVQQEDGDLKMFNFGREDLFKKHIKDPKPWDKKSWEGHNGRHDLVLYDPGQQMATLRRPDGSSWVFHTEGRPGSLVGHLTRIVSKNGNRIKFKYQSSHTQQDLLKRKLRSITESYGRKIVFVYDGNRVTSIRDFSGREVHYSYSAGGQLQSVRSPVVISTAGLNDFPEGKKTLYTYHNAPHALLKNALTSVVSPNQEAGGQEPRLVWQYNTDEQDRYFGYVTSHTVGNPSASITLAAGGTYLYQYEQVGDNSELNGGVNAAAVRTTVLDRRSTPTTMELNRFGHPLQETIYTQGKRLGGAESYVRNFEYRETDDHHGDLSAVTHPIGNTYHHGHSEHEDQPPTSDGNQTVQEHPVDLRGGDQDVLRSEVVYEPIFNLPFKTINPRGFEPGRNPDDFTTLYIFDYMEDLGAALAKFAPKLGLEKDELQSLFDKAGITGFATDQNRDGKQDQSNGNVIAIKYPLVQLPEQAEDLGLNTAQEASEIFQYNAFGQLTRHWDTEENVTDYEYFGASDPDGDGNIDFPLKDPTSGGYRKRVIRDAIAYPGRNSDQNPDPVVQETRYEYTAQGSFPANLRGIRTAEIDPRGAKHIYLVNELDQVVKAVRASADHAFETITIYDRNNNVVERRVQNKDTLDPGEDDFIVQQATYDILDQKTSETHDVGGLAIVNTYAYDSSQNLVERVHGENSAQERTESFEYDERDILIRSTRGAGSTEQSTHTSEIDDNGNIVRTIDAEGDHQTQTIHDGFDRPWRRVDRLGNQEYMTYDSAGNVVSVERQDASGVRLSQTDRHYDERNRLFRVDEHIFHYPGQEVGDIDDGDLDPGDGRVSTVTIYDRAGRVVGAVNACAQITETRYDGLGRVLRRIDSLDNLTDHEYDANGNLVMTTATEKSSLVGNEVFEESFTYDSLNRRLTSVEPNGQTTRFTYDSRGNRIKTIDALGNQVEYRYDRLSRLVDTRKYLSVDGTGASASNKDLAQGGGDGVITLLQSWDPLNRLVAQTDDNGNTTAYTYDDLDRRIARGYADGTSETWTYNRDSELITHTTPNGSVETWTRDAEGRATRVVIQDPGASIPGTTEKTWAYDGLGRQVLATDNNIPHDAADDVRCDYIYDSLSRKIRETQTIGVLPALHVDTEWRGGHQQVSRTYPNGRVVERSYDDLDRLFEIREQGDSSLIARFEYVGPERDVRTTYGNGAVLDKRNFAGTQTTSGPGAGYDANRRHVRHEWQTGGGAQITAYVNTYNGPGGIGTNRRSSETREHLFGHTDTYGFDSAYRMLSFLRNDAVASARGLDGADKMLAFSDEGTDRMPVVDGDPGQEGMNQYSSFDGSGATNREYYESSALRAEAFDGDPLFSGPTNFAVGTAPISVALGDLNGDMNPDLAVANQNSHDVSILLGDGAGGFSAPTSFAAGTGPRSVAIGDLNGDMNPDLAVANQLSDDVSILLGDGAGGFSGPTNFSVAPGHNTASVAIGDLNGDLKPDLALANLSTDDVSILLGNGDGTFGGATTFAAGSDPLSVAIGDLNGDMNPDLAVANLLSHNVSILLGDGAGGFSAPTNFDTGTHPAYVAIGDLNGDLSADLAFANLGPTNGVSILLGDGTGGFSTPTHFAAGCGPYGLAIGDLNGDLIPDLAAANVCSNDVSILLGDGAGGFSAPTNFAAGEVPRSVAIGDLNGDMSPDLAVLNHGQDLMVDSNVSILLNQGGGPLALEYVYDYADRLVEVRQGGGGLLARYTYAADNRRVLAFEAASAETLRYLYDGWQVVEARDVTGGADTPRRLYVDGRGIDEHIQLLLLEEHPRENLGSPFYYHASSQGSVGALTDADQNVVEYYEYRWLGERLRLDSSKQMASPESAVGNPYGFQGRRHERGLPLCYYRNRYYNVVTGEFLTIDPKGNWNHEQGNGFSAFGEDGWNMADPFGLDIGAPPYIPPPVFLQLNEMQLISESKLPFGLESEELIGDVDVSSTTLPNLGEIKLDPKWGVGLGLGLVSNSTMISVGGYFVEKTLPPSYAQTYTIVGLDNLEQIATSPLLDVQDSYLEAVYGEPTEPGYTVPGDEIVVGANSSVEGGGPISIGNGVNEVSPSLEIMHRLHFWFNDDVRLAVPSVSIPYGQRFISTEKLSDLDASLWLGWKY